MDLHGVVLAHRRKQILVTEKAKILTGRAWSQVDRGDVEGSWARLIPNTVGLTRAAMTASAAGSSDFVSAALRVQHAKPAPVATVNPAGFAQAASDGRPLGSLLYTPVISARAATATGMSQADALDQALTDLLMIVTTEVADAGRQAVNAAMVADPRVAGYYREPGPSACGRCAILSGKWYSTYDGASFERHPRCQCTASPGASRGSGNPISPTPKAYFDSLTASRQDLLFSKGGAQAIRDGADINQVINASRGMSKVGHPWTTTEGATRHGIFGGHTAKGVSGAPRLTPAAIYQLAADPEEAIQMLKDYGYLF